MLKTIKYNLQTGWHLARWVRLALGIALLAQAIATSDVLVGVFAMLLLGQAVMNTGCCGSSGCSTPLAEQQKKDTTGPID